MVRHTKIGATIGPASAAPETMAALLQAGVDFARFNFSHGALNWHEQTIGALGRLAEQQGVPLSILQDLRGPRLRIGLLETSGVAVESGKVVTFNTAIPEARNGELPLEAPGLTNQLKVGERLLIDDGRIEARTIKLEADQIFAEVVEGGLITSHKGVNFPDSALDIPVFTPKDRADARLGVRLGVDFMALSFVKSAQDILDLRWFIQEAGESGGESPAPPIGIIAKIERHEAVENLAEIIAAADGIMVARGDLGLELPGQEGPLIQKRIIDLCRAAAKPVIVATQLLDSMTHSRRPTRAEVSDVANAVIDHADALLLTNETAVGERPAETVKTMADIITATEKSAYDDTALPRFNKKGVATEVAITELSRVLAEEVKAKLILAGSLTGETGRRLSQVRPELPLLVATSHPRVERQLNLSWGVQPFILLPCNSIEEFVARSVTYIKQTKLAKVGDKIIVVAGEPVGQAGNVNLVEVREIR